MKTQSDARGPDPGQLFSYLEIPIGSVIIGADSLVRQTGQWRYVRPSLVEKIPPCQKGCPLGTPVREVIDLVRQRRYAEALRLTKEENPFPGICGRVCYHPCEANCLRGEFDEPTNINALERFISDSESMNPSFGGNEASLSSKNVAIVGGGPAGLSCSYFLSGMGHHVTLFEKIPLLGGMLRVGIPAYRLPREVLNREIQCILDRGVNVVAPAIVGQDVKWEELQSYDAVFMAMGNHRSLKLHIPGEEAEGVFSGIDFLRTINMGEAIPLGKRVGIIGGGNTAFDMARVVSRLGSTPLIFYRRDRREMPATEDEVREAEDEKIPIHFLTIPIKIHTEQGRVKAIECLRTTLEYDEKGRSRVNLLEGTNFIIDVDAVICAIGEEIDTSHLPWGWEIMDGKIPVSQTLLTKEQGFFAGGDMISQQKTVVHAIASGKLGAICIDMYLKREKPEDFLHSLRIGQDGPVSMRAYRYHQDQGTIRVISSKEINVAYFDARARPTMPKLPLGCYRSGFDEVNLGLDETLALEAADRCFHCGSCMLCENCYTFCPEGVVYKNSTERRNLIDYDYCKGCGICQNECPIGAIEMDVEEGE